MTLLLSSHTGEHPRATRIAPLVRSFADLDSTRLDRARPVVTLFSGGLDSSYLLYRLARSGFRDIHAISVDLGANEAIEEQRRVADTFDVTLRILDGRQAFLDDYVRPAIAAQATYLDTHPISASLSRPLIAKLATEVASELGASAILHTANRSQNTLRRLNGALRLLGWAGLYGSPYDREPVSREQKQHELAEAGIVHMGERVASIDSNLWCREFESGVLDDPERHQVPSHLFQWSARRPDAVRADISIGFVSGVPSSIDGEPRPLLDIIETLNLRVGAFGIGRYSGLEHLAGEQKVLELREMPAAWILLRSYRHLETAALTSETIRSKMMLEQIWVREALEGRWFGELRAAAQSFIDVCARPITGEVGWHLTPGSAETRSIAAKCPRYLRNREDWELLSVESEQ